MGGNAEERRWLEWYGRLVRLYPRPFREQFGTGLAQTFQDLCRERRGAGRGVAGLAAWVFFETFVSVVRANTEHMEQLSKTVLRVALAALGLLMVPLVASMLIPDWHWGVGGFVFAYVMFFGTGMAYALIAKKMSAWAYKAGVGLALAAGFALGWSNMVHVSDSENPANLAYFGVLVVGIIGALVARLKARGLAWTLFAMAGVLAVISMLVPSEAPPEMSRNMAVGHGVYVVLFAVSGVLFRRAGVAEGR